MKAPAYSEIKNFRGFFMQRVRKQVGVTEEMNTMLSGRPVSIAVLDSGIAKHPDLMENILAFRDFINDKQEIYDDLGHGTHVSGIIAGDGKCLRGMYRGMAPLSRLIVGKILNHKGEGETTNILKALDWIEQVRTKYDIRILNLSAGLSDSGEESKQILMQQRIDRLWDKGIVVVCAAGNNGPEDDSISAIGTRSQAIVVGCHDEEYCKNRKGKCEDYSGRGRKESLFRKPDLVAPGTEIISCNAFYENKYNGKRQYYVAKSGTSMAAPIVSGAIALALQAEPELNPNTLRTRLLRSTRDLGEAWNKQGYGMLDCKKMLGNL